MVRRSAAGAAYLCLATGLVACDAPREVWQSVTRNAGYRAALDAGIGDVQGHIARLEEQRRTLSDPGSPPTHRVTGLLASLTSHYPPRPEPKQAIDADLRVLRDHLRELKRERAELAGDVPPKRRRCPVHGNWMFREVVATESTDVPGMTPVEGRLEAWKYPYRGRAAPYSTTQLLPYTRPWICSACQEAYAHWKPRLAQHLGSNAWPIDNDHLLIEAVIAVEQLRLQCRRALDYSPIETPYYLNATFTALPDGTLSDPEFAGSEHALETELTRCLTQVIRHGRLSKRPPEPLELERLPMWLEL